MMIDIVGLMQTTANTVDTKGMSVTPEGGQGSKRTWIGIGTVLSSSTAGTQE
jgi:hypothetical protein